MSISLDGFVAGPDQSREHPLGKRGIELHSWHIGDERANDADEIAVGWLMRSRGAYVMGRNMFGPIRGEWEADWRGWWGAEPPYHAPVFVLTHYPHEPIDIAPVLLGSGERIFEGVESFGMEPVEVLHSPLATHIRYRRSS
jgi:dihydrofolate reductase